MVPGKKCDRGLNNFLNSAFSATKEMSQREKINGEPKYSVTWINLSIWSLIGEQVYLGYNHNKSNQH